MNGPANDIKYDTSLSALVRLTSEVVWVSQVPDIVQSVLYRIAELVEKHEKVRFLTLIFDLQGSISVWDPSPAIIPTQSRVWCTIFVIIIDCVVGAIVEQISSSTFKFCLLKIYKICPLKRLIFASKCTKMRSVAGTHWGAYSAPPEPLAGLKGGGKRGKTRRGEEMKKTRTPQCLKYVHAHGQL